MEIYTTTQARKNLSKLVELAAASHEPVYIVGKKHKVVLISEQDYSAIMETFYLNSIPEMKDSIIQSSQKSLDEFGESLE